MNNSPSMSELRDVLYYVIDESLVALFYKAFDAGGDIVLQRQFENDPRAKVRYAERCVKEARDKSADLITQHIKQAALELRPEKWGPVDCDAGALCDGDMCCSNIPYENRAYNKALDDWTERLERGLK